jgi:hypothetical protein
VSPSFQRSLSSKAHSYFGHCRRHHADRLVTGGADHAIAALADEIAVERLVA